MSDKTQLDELREILLEQDREERRSLSEEVDTIRDEVTVREKLEPKIGPIIEARLEYMRKNFPELYGAIITKTIKTQIRESRDEMIDALYPIAGRMIRKYIRKELQMLSERIDAQIQQTFSLKGILGRITGIFGKRKMGEEILSKAISAQIQQIFIIDRESGLLIGNFSEKESMDADMVAGMMTAIRSFGEDALGNNGSLQTIEYDSNQLMFMDLHSMYFAVLVKGVVSARFEEKLTDELMRFAEENLSTSIDEVSEEVTEEYSRLLKHHFDQFNEKSK